MSAPASLQNGGILPPGLVPNQGLAPLESIPDSKVLVRYDEIQAAKGNAQLVYAAVPGPTLATIYRPGMPIRMVSALDPTSLKEGEFSLLQNVRPDNDVITARYPTTLFGTTATTFSPSIAGCSARGVWSGNLNGTQYVVTAWYDGAAVRLYSSTNGYTFTEVTATSSAYGLSGAGTPSRFPDSGRNCQFQSVTNIGPAGVSTDYLVIQNGTADPIIYSATAIHSASTFPIQSVSAPTYYESIAPQATVAGFWNLSSWTLTSVVTGGGPAVTPNDGAYILNYSSSLASPGTVTLTTPSSSDYLSTAGASQVCLLIAYEAGFDTYLAGMALSVYDATPGGAGWTAIFDPATDIGSSTAGLGSAPAEVGLDPVLLYGTAAVLAYTSPAFASANSGAGMQITAIKFTVPAGVTAPSTTGGVAIFGVYSGGSFPASSALAVSYQNSATLTESPSVILLPATGAPNFSSIGVPNILSVFTGSLPLDPSLNYNLNLSAVASSQFASGVDTLNLYVSEPGSTTFGYLSSTSIASYSGSWSASAATSVVAGQSSARTSVIPGGNPVDTYTAPDAYITNMPSGTCVTGGSGRTFVGVRSQYWFSEYLFPFRYRLVLDIENGVVRASSGGYVTLPNTETCAQWAVAGAAALGTSNLFLFTDKSIYNIQGPDGLSLSQPSLLASIGCSAPDSVALYRDSIFFVDDNYQITKFSYGQSQFYFYQNVNSYQLLQPISKRVVDDQTRAIPPARLASAVGCAVYDRYYLGYTPAGGSTNSLMLVFDMTIGSFVLDTPTVSGMTAEAMVPCTIGGRSVYCQSSDLQCYEWENTSSSSPVSVEVSSPAMNPGGFAKSFFGRVGVVMDAQGTGVSLPISKILIAGGNSYGTVNSDSSSISLDPATVSGGQIFRWDSKTLVDSTTGPAGMSALTCQIVLGPISMTPATRILAIVQEQTTASPGADAL
jgi:hypothetical protein